ncbi:MAG: DUF502 domain-containing protein [Longimicrobiales bacterium]|nr:DUF502 domain-containing protein [Longimicrobiales bacterium]
MSGGLGKLFRRRLIAGLIVIAPLGVTAYILWWLFTTLDGILGRSLYDIIGFEIPGLGLVLLVFLLLAVGWVAEATVGSKVVEWWHRALDRVPIVSRLYGATRRIVGSVFGSEERRFFRSVVLFEYPSPGQWTLGFETGRAPRALENRIEDGVTVFLPTAPNPVTGFLIIVPAARIVRLPVTIEEGFTYVFSAGAVPPTGPMGTEPPPPGARPGPGAPSPFPEGRPEPPVEPDARTEPGGRP